MGVTPPNIGTCATCAATTTTNQKRNMKYQKFQTFAEAEAASSDEQKQHIADARAFNAREAARDIKRISETSTEFIVAGGWIFYITPSDLPNESGLEFLNELNLVCSIMDNSSFYRVIKTFKFEIGLQRDHREGQDPTQPWAISRSMKARKLMAEKNWTVTTLSLIHI